MALISLKIKPKALEWPQALHIWYPFLSCSHLLPLSQSHCFLLMLPLPPRSLEPDTLSPKFMPPMFFQPYSTWFAVTLVPYPCFDVTSNQVIQLKVLLCTHREWPGSRCLWFGTTTNLDNEPKQGCPTFWHPWATH